MNTVTVIVKGNASGDMKSLNRSYVVEMDGNIVKSLNGKECVRLDRTSRTVYRCGNNFVIKFLSLGHPTGNQNRREYDNWQKIQPEDRENFATVIGYADVLDGSILIQKFVPGKLNENTNRLYGHEARRLANKYGIGDMHSGNYKVKDGKVIIFDIGM